MNDMVIQALLDFYSRVLNQIFRPSKSRLCAPKRIRLGRDLGDSVASVFSRFGFDLAELRFYSLTFRA